MCGHFLKNGHHLAKKNDDFLTKKDGQKNVNVPFRTFVTSRPWTRKIFSLLGHTQVCPPFSLAATPARLKPQRSPKAKELPILYAQCAYIYKDMHVNIRIHIYIHVYVYTHI